MSLVAATNISYDILHHFDDGLISPVRWDKLVEESCASVFMTWHYQKAWWKAFGRGKLIIVVARKGTDIIAIAPLFEDAGMIYFVGSGGSDYLDFIGDVEQEQLLQKMLTTAIKGADNFLGFLFYHVQKSSQKLQLFTRVANELDLMHCFEGEQSAPFLSIKDFPEKTLAATRKKSLLRHEAWFIKYGELQVQHSSTSKEILPQLTDFFEQHKRRWESTPFPSLFNDEKQCLFYKELSKAADDTGHIHFTTVRYKDKPIAYHFGFFFCTQFLWYKPSFAVEFSKQSPGEVLLRNLLLYAIEIGADMFDFGLGDEAFKQRFATGTRSVINIGLYPKTNGK